MALTSKFFTSNRKVLLKKAGVDLILVSANAQMQRSGDVTYPFRQNSYFFYLTGINDPNVILVMTKSDTYLIMPTLSDSQKIFDGDHDINQMQKISGITETHNRTSGWKKLETDLLNAKSVGVLVGRKPEVDFILNDANGLLYKEIRKSNKSKKFVDVRRFLVEQRMVKQSEEIQEIQKAIDITLKGFAEVEKNLKSYKIEKEIEAKLTAHFIKSGAVNGYPPIVGSGEAACTLHYIKNSQKIGGAQILIDAGAEVNNYSADITRTFSLSKKGTRQAKRFEEVYFEVHRLQEFALSLLIPGITLKEYEEKVAYEAEKSIKKIRGNDARLRDFYPHATSHHLGLDVHDVADYSKPLEAGNVITVEPGIYIPDEGIGVRIEDDVLITKTGVRVLS